MNIFQKYHSSGYQGQFLGQKPKTKIPGRISCVPPWCGAQWTNVKDWPNRCLDPEDFDLYARHDSGLCLKTAYFPFIDIDLEDEDLVHQIAWLITNELGLGMARSRGGTNRVGLVFKCEQPFKPLPLVRFSRHYELVDGKPKSNAEQVEFLCNGSHFVAEGIHPSGNRYNIITFMPAVELPTITEDQLISLRSKIAELVPPGAVIESHPTHSKTSVQSDNIIDLYEDFEIFTDIGPTTVGEILADPGKYKYCQDPYEPDYGNGNNRIGIIYRNRDSVIINSYAHGGVIYSLHDRRNKCKLMKSLEEKKSNS